MATSTRAKIRKDLNRIARIAEEVEREVVVFMDADMPDLVSTKEAAEIVGMTRTAVSTARARGKFPEPAVVLACGPIWRREDIVHWHETR